MESKRWYDVQEAAAYLAVRPYTVRDAIWSGQLAYCKLGKRFILDRADLDRFAESRKQREPVN